MAKLRETSAQAAEFAQERVEVLDETTPHSDPEYLISRECVRIHEGS